MKRLDLSGVVYELRVSPRRRCVDTDVAFYLRAGRDHLCLRLWMEEEQIRSLAIVTASNPGGRVLASSTNYDRMLDLRGIVCELHYDRMQRRADEGLCIEPCYNVVSTPGCGNEEHESHLAVPDVDKQWATNMAARFGQAAFLWIERTWTAPRDAQETARALASSDPEGIELYARRVGRWPDGRPYVLQVPTCVPELVVL